MLCWIVLVIPAIVAAEKSACKTGVSTCDGSATLSVVDNVHYCCDTGFNMQWTALGGLPGSTPTDCACQRYFTETECLVGADACQTATSWISDGNDVQCCKNGDSMNSVSNAVINGVNINYCKCTHYSTTVNGSPITPEDSAALDTFMEEFGQNISQWSQNVTCHLGYILGNMGVDLLDQSGGILGQWTALALDQIRRRFGLQEELDCCSTNPCGHNSVCHKEPLGYRCECPEPFTGQLCDVYKWTHFGGNILGNLLNIGKRHGRSVVDQDAHPIFKRRVFRTRPSTACAGDDTRVGVAK